MLVTALGAMAEEVTDRGVELPSEVEVEEGEDAWMPMTAEAVVTMMAEAMATMTMMAEAMATMPRMAATSTLTLRRPKRTDSTINW